MTNTEKGINIKETMILRSKDVDKFFNESKRLLLQIDVLQEELTQNKKRLKSATNELKALNNWIKTK